MPYPHSDHPNTCQPSQCGYNLTPGGKCPFFTLITRITPASRTDGQTDVRTGQQSGVWVAQHVTHKIHYNTPLQMIQETQKSTYNNYLIFIPSSQFILVACPRLNNSLCLSVGRSVGWSHFIFFYDFMTLTSRLLPKWSGDLKYGPCLPARDFGSRVSGLVYISITIQESTAHFKT